MKLNLACGQNKLEGFVNADLYGEPDVRVDLMQFPWPWKDGEVEEVYCAHFVEHIPGHLRPAFFNELYRIMSDNGKATIITPHWSSERAYGDPTHQWPPVTRFGYLYLNKEWRTQNKVDHYVGYTCDFNWSASFTINAAYLGRASDYMQRAVESMTNVVDDLVVQLTKIPPVIPAQ